MQRKPCPGQTSLVKGRHGIIPGAGSIARPVDAIRLFVSQPIRRGHLEA